MLRRAATFLLGFAIASLVPANSQAPAASSSQTPLVKSETRDVVVDVVVTKRNGEPVHGLSKQDFEVLEDGKPQALDFFEEKTASTATPAAAPELPPMPAGTVNNAPTAREDSVVTVLLLDYLNTEPQDQVYVHRQIMEFFKKMKPGTRMAIFLLGSKLRCVQGFTSDGTELLAALKKSSTGPQREAAFHTRSDNASDQAQIGQMILMQKSQFGIEAIRAAQADLQAFDYETRANRTFQALNYLAQYLGGVPGRKNLIWFAGSFPVLIFPQATARKQAQSSPMPGQGQSQAPQSIHMPTGSRVSALTEYERQNQHTADLLTGSRVSVYPVGAQGMMTEHVMDADNAGPGAQDGGGRGGSMQPYQAESDERAGLRMQMEQLASDTGGQAFYNTNDIAGAIRKALEDGSDYYTLSYSPQDKRMDGKYRRIEVRVSGGHYKLFYRRGYNADAAPPASAGPARDPLASVLKLGLPDATGVLFGVHAVPVNQHLPDDAARLGENTALKGPLTRYRVNFYVRTSDVSFNPVANGELTGSIHVGIIAFDEDGNAVNWTSGDQAMHVTQERYEQLLKSGIPAQMQIDLPNKNLTLLTGVYDGNSGRAGSLQMPLHFGAAPPAPSEAAATARPVAGAPGEPAASSALPLPPASLRKVTQVGVNELTQVVEAEQAAHKNDGAIAARLGSLQMTERLSEPALQRIAKQMHPGPRTAEALDVLADSSALLPPPSSAFLDVPAPVIKAQGEMYQKAIDYVVNTLTRLPNFIATRRTRSFDNAPMVLGHSGFAPVTDEHLVGTFERQITYRDGKEVLEAGSGGKPKQQAGPSGLATWGEFGPALAIVLSDSLKGRVTWSHWEQTPDGRLAVFHYRVPKPASHFVVNYCCLWSALNAGSTASTAGFRNNPTNQYAGTGPNDEAAAAISYHGTPAYHGDLYIDPQTGAVLRVTVDAEFENAAILTRASVAIQYGKVEIGGKTYICPVRSVSISADRNRPGFGAGGQSGQVVRLNETTFVDYHRFGSTSRILPATP
ncbi:MAG: VWA domain-containing protein [Acidobacteriota bacterium]